MAKLVGTNVNAPIVPGSDTDTYATHFDEYGKGGYRAVNTIAERDSISYERRSIGMEVRVLTGEDAGVYYLESFSGDDFEGVTAQSWVKASEGGGSGTSGSKEVYSGYYESGDFFLLKEDGSGYVVAEKISGVIYLDVKSGYSYHYDEESASFEKINSLSWTEV